jgi:7-carboxy-7-deazaguanine synthase
MRIVETFRSIQGEGTWAGCPCIFVRLGGCNLRCAWCDTPYAQGDDGTEQTVAQVVESALALGSGPVCVTGGEPLVQASTPDLVRALIAAGRNVQVMTNGTIPLTSLPREATLVVDVKTPWSGESSEMQGAGGRAPDRFDLPQPRDFHRDNLAWLSRRDEVKFVVRDRREFEWAALWAEKHGLFDRVGAVLVGAAWGELETGVLADWILESRLPLRLNLQWHKLLWGGGTRR